MTGKVFHLANKTVLDLTHDEAKYFIDITDAQAISGENIKCLQASPHKGKNYWFVFKSKTKTLYIFIFYTSAQKIKSPILSNSIVIPLVCKTSITKRIGSSLVQILRKSRYSWILTQRKRRSLIFQTLTLMKITLANIQIVGISIILKSILMQKRFQIG